METDCSCLTHHQPIFDGPQERIWLGAYYRNCCGAISGCCLSNRHKQESMSVPLLYCTCTIGTGPVRNIQLTCVLKVSTWQEGDCEKHPVNAYIWSYMAHTEGVEKSLSTINFEKNRGPVRLKEFVLQFKLKTVLAYRKRSLLLISLLICRLPPLRLLSVSKMSIRCPLLTSNIIFEFHQWNTKVMLPACFSVFFAIQTVDYNNRTCFCQGKKQTKTPYKHNTVKAPPLNYNYTRLSDFNVSIQVPLEKYDAYVCTVL